METAPGRRARDLLSGFANSADLGGLLTPDGSRTAHRRLVRSDVPAHLGGADRGAARRFGFATVVDLRSTPETRTVPHPLGDLDGYRALPLIDPAAETVREPAAEPTVGEVYAASLTRNAIPIAAILHTLAAAPAGPVMICCTAGRDRTGMITALVLDLVGVDRATIAADYVLVGHDARPAPPPPANGHAAPGAPVLATGHQGGSCGSQPRAPGAEAVPRRRGTADILHMLSHVHRTHGCTAGYLHWLGLRPEEVAALQARLLP